MSDSKNIVLVHGIFDTERIFKNVSNLMTAHGYKTFSINLRPNYGIAGIEDLAFQLKIFAESKIPRGEQFSLIGFSMGGIVSRHYLQNLGGTNNVNKFIAVSSPHYGTVLSYLLPLKGSLQMRPGSTYLRNLNSNVDSLLPVRPVSFWTKYDQMIIPQKSAIMSVGDSVQMPIFPHRRMVTSKLASHALVECIRKNEF
ncbi:esterase/lipase family protein [Allochromatium vinosum]|uniref:Lipase, class 2 n=1 Tax=Allochromatium vinosum (strain ATCC 17899 / DSM 180 / NBRC 103801 / NCIMB 10441 / D) TaxID=572477 RepID=D3RWH8_ALLVD|nr:lipase, class 2 [Allochromatium vinosum]ADC64190.1 lipase, class 2 [Allochromatium vinosum DSM 180]